MEEQPQRIRSVNWLAFLLLAAALILTLKFPAVVWQNLGSIYLNHALAVRPAHTVPSDFSTATHAFSRAFALTKSVQAAYHLVLLAIWQGGDIPPDGANEDVLTQAGSMLTQRAEAIAREGQTDTLVTWYERGQGLGVPLPNYWKAVGQVYAEAGQWELAAGAFDRAVRAAPDSQAALYNLGRAYVQQSEYDKALPVLEKAVDQSAEEVGVSNIYYHLGLAYLYRVDNPDLSAARRAFQMALDLDDFGPTDHRTSTLFQLGASYTLAQDWSAAIPYYRAVLDRVPDHFEGHVHLARAYWQNGDLEQAINIGRQAVALQPKAPATYLDLGVMYQSLGDVKEAQALYEQARQLAPDDPQIMSRLEALQGERP